MISYLVATVPWTLGCLALSPNNPRAIKYRKTLAGLFFGSLVPLIYFFIQHKVHKVAGGESVASMEEKECINWSSLYDIFILRVGTCVVRCQF